MTLTATAHQEALSVTWSLSNRLWAGAFRRLSVAIRRRRVSIARPAGVAPEPSGLSAEAAVLLERVRAIDWYHSIDLGRGVVTPGRFDHGRHLAEYRLPTDLGGLRALDVGTWDGFWAFELERRGADVVAIDIPYRADVDLPPATRDRLARELPEEQRSEPTGRGFSVAKEALGSRVRRETLSVYDLGPDRLGTFDVTHVGDLLIHLKNPLTALERIHSVTRRYAIISETYYPELDDRGGQCVMEYMSGQRRAVWWRFGQTSMRQMLLDAGFTRVEVKNTFRVRMQREERWLHHVVFWAHV
jgi:tRNA (mo5U34)-methyltransferase